MPHTTMQLAGPRFWLRWRLSNSCVTCQEVVGRQEGPGMVAQLLAESMEEDHREVDPWRR
jgi:hypothetical protein